MENIFSLTSTPPKEIPLIAQQILRFFLNKILGKILEFFFSSSANFDYSWGKKIHQIFYITRLKKTQG
jgi:hypothetical protein